MKKKIVFSLLFLAFSFLVCMQITPTKEVLGNTEYVTMLKSDGSGPITHYGTSEPVYTPKEFVEKDEELRAMWVSAVTPDVVKHTSQYNFKSGMQRVIRTLKENNMNTLIYHVRPTNDAFYPSKLNPWSRYFLGKYSDAEIDIVDPGWDPFAWLVEECHQNNIEIHAWFNPYRVTTVEPEGLTKEEYLQTKLHEKNFARQHPEYVVQDTTKKLLLNPGEPAVIQFIQDTVMEVVENYDIDGVHFDDYFYSYEGYDTPFDQEQYEKYHLPNQSLDDWRRSNVDTMIRELGQKIRNYNSTHDTEVAFGISPFGIWDNKRDNPLGSNTAGTSSYRTCYADTRKWVKEEWIDYIMPQIYWHFEHSVAPYADLIDWWVDVVKETKVNLYIGHAVYKYDKRPVEWKDSPDELALQLQYNTKYEEVKGSSFFSYNYIRDMNTFDKYLMIKNVMEKITTTMWKSQVAVPKEYLAYGNTLSEPQEFQNKSNIQTENLTTFSWLPAVYSGNEDINYQFVYRIDQQEWKTLPIDDIIMEDERCTATFLVPEGEKIEIKIQALAGGLVSESMVLEENILPAPPDIIFPNNYDIDVKGTLHKGAMLTISWEKIQYPLDLEVFYQLTYLDRNNQWVVVDINDLIYYEQGRLYLNWRIPDVDRLIFQIETKSSLFDVRSNAYQGKLIEEITLNAPLPVKNEIGKGASIVCIVTGGILSLGVIGWILLDRKKS